MSKTPIYNKTMKEYYGDMVLGETEPVDREPKLSFKEKIAKVLTPAVRRWGYGVTAAALTVGATLAGKPEFIAVVAPLLIAIWYVTPEGEPR